MHSIKDIVKQLIGKSLDAYNTNYTKVLNTRIDNIVAQAGNDNTEIVDARIDSAGVTHTTLNNRILAETKMNDEQLIEYTGSSLSVDDTMPGYLQNIEIKGNTIQNEVNLEDIRSVGDKIEGQELYEIPVLSNNSSIIVTNIHKDDMCISHTINDFTSSFELMNRGSFDVTVLIHKGGVWQRDVIAKPNKITKIELKDGERVYRIYFYKHSGWDLTKDYNFDSIVQANTKLEEDKLTILSPTPLEKVGDVADRIICKDGVWGVEKNVITTILNGSRSWTLYGGNTSNTFAINFKFSDMKTDNVVLCDKLQSNATCWEDKDNNIGIHSSSSQGLIIRLLKSYLDTVNVQGAKDWLQANLPTIKYPTTQPQFIPLPHDQQVKLRTFANKTNISFLTEIEGTIKAQVPKSLGATVNTHTEQISNLNKELDRVKKLEESTVSTVETESDFTTVEATSNGYFEDVKLEGKTLVNLIQCNNKQITTPSTGFNRYDLGDNSKIKPNTTYTIVYWSTKNIGHAPVSTNGAPFSLVLGGCTSVDNWGTRFIPPNGDIQEYGISIFNTSSDYYQNNEKQFLLIAEGNSGSDFNLNILILEGDHTQNPPSYFEGLKSVGQDVDEIVVSSVKGDNLKTIEYSSIAYNSDHILATFKYVIKGNVYIHNHSNKPIYIPCRKSSWTRNLLVPPNSSIYTSLELPDEVLYAVRLLHSDGWKDAKLNLNAILSISNEPINRDKKRLLFYNNETQTWEKPILREWDSIEKHSDGKYYYHQRSGEVVLNGSENEYWTNAIIASNTNTIRFALNNIYTSATNKYMGAISDKFKIVYNDGDIGADSENIGINGYANALFLTIEKSKLSSQDLTGFKQWLQANNVTVVYQLAEEKVYECTNIDLITYTNETNYIVESGSIVPKSTLKVHNNISNVVSLLQKKVSLLESNMTKYMVTQNRMQLASTYSTDSVTFKVDYFSLCGDEENYDEDLYNLILNNILVGKDNYNYDKMFTMILDYASWNQISWEQFDILVGLMDIQHNPPVEEEITEDESIEETPVE